MTQTTFVSVRRVAGAVFVSMFCAPILADLGTNGPLHPLVALGIGLAVVYVLGWLVLPRTIVDEKGVTTFSGWARGRRFVPWSEFQSIAVQERSVLLVHSGGALRIRGLDDGIAFAYRLPARLAEAAAFISDAHDQYTQQQQRSG